MTIKRNIGFFITNLTTFSQLIRYIQTNTKYLREYLVFRRLLGISRENKGTM